MRRFLFFLLLTSRLASAAEFQHPGLLHNREGLAFIKAKVAAHEEPWVSGWKKLRSERIASLAWKPKPVADVFRGVNGSGDVGASALMIDSAAAYAHALEWNVTGERAHAAKAIEILNAWSSVLRSIGGHDQKLLAGITAYKLCNAAEILRGSDSGWKAEDRDRFRAMLLTVFNPLLKEFVPKANGNWDAAMNLSTMSIAVYCDDHEQFDRAVEYFLHGTGNGAIGHYVLPSGQCQESTRDQPHTQLGLGMLAATCEIAWKQGVDLYGAEDNRLLIGFEYTAKYNLGYDVPCVGKISEKGRGLFRPIYEKVYEHYAHGKGLPMPFTKEVIEKIRPEGWSPDHESWGTLTAVRSSSL